jgi:hypothetical protein
MDRVGNDYKYKYLKYKIKYLSTKQNQTGGKEKSVLYLTVI